MGNAGYGNHTEDTKNSVDSKRRDAQAGGGTAPEGQSSQGEGKGSGGNPAAGPHDKPSLTNPDSTPGTGALPEPGERRGTDSTSG